VRADALFENAAPLVQPMKKPATLIRIWEGIPTIYLDGSGGIA